MSSHQYFSFSAPQGGPVKNVIKLKRGSIWGRTLKFRNEKKKFAKTTYNSWKRTMAIYILKAKVIQCYQLSSLQSHTWQFGGNLAIFLPLWFYVKSIFGDFRVSKSAILTTSAALNFNFPKFLT